MTLAKNILFPILLLWLLAVATSCKKPIIDYRDKYVGAWEFEVISITYIEGLLVDSMGEPRTGVVTKGYGAYGLDIDFGGKFAMQVHVNEDGVFDHQLGFITKKYLHYSRESESIHMSKRYREIFNLLGKKR